MILGINFTIITIASLILKLLYKNEDKKTLIEKLSYLVILINLITISYFVTDTGSGFLKIFFAFSFLSITSQVTNRNKDILNEIVLVLCGIIAMFLLLQAAHLILINFGLVFILTVTPLQIIYSKRYKFTKMRIISLTIIIILWSTLIYQPNSIINTDIISIQEKIAKEFLAQEFGYYSWDIQVDQKIRGKESIIIAHNDVQNYSVKLIYKNSNIIEFSRIE